MPDKFRNKYRIPSARLSSWDYSNNGAYFITINTANRKHYFGCVNDARVELSQIGEFANECWLNIPHHFPHFTLDEFVIMPNHVHGIVLIEKPYIEINPHFKFMEVNGESKHPRFRNQGRNTVSAMVGSFKSAVTKKCNENSLKFGWQARFHDHIIRNLEEFHRIRKYILMNPRRWKDI